MSGNTRRAGPGGHHLSLSDKINRGKKSVKAKGLPGCQGSVWVLEHHKPVTTLFLRSVDLGVERFRFLGIIKTDNKRRCLQTVFRTFLEHLLEDSNTSWVKTQRKRLFSVLPGVVAAPPLNAEGNVTLFQKKWTLTTNFLFQYWPCTDPQEVLLATDVWRNEMVFIWGDVLRFTGQKCSWRKRLLLVPGGENPPPAEHGCGFYTPHGENQLQTETAAESWANEAGMGFKITIWVAYEEWGQLAPCSLIRSLYNR